MKAIHKVTLGFSLIEVVLALGVAAVSLIPVFALLPVSLNSTHNATVQTPAMNLVTAIAADIRATPPKQTTSTRFSINISGSTVQTFYFNEAGECSTTMLPGSQSRFKALIQTLPQLSGSSGMVINRITISWPPEAANAMGSVEAVVSLPMN